MIVFYECNVFASSLLSLANTEMIGDDANFVGTISTMQKVLVLPHFIILQIQMCHSFDHVSQNDYIYFMSYRYL
jgi:hypothetical protein